DDCRHPASIAPEIADVSLILRPCARLTGSDRPNPGKSDREWIPDWARKDLPKHCLFFSPSRCAAQQCPSRLSRGNAAWGERCDPLCHWARLAKLESLRGWPEPYRRDFRTERAASRSSFQPSRGTTYPTNCW